MFLLAVFYLEVLLKSIRIGGGSGILFAPQISLEEVPNQIAGGNVALGPAVVAALDFVEEDVGGGTGFTGGDGTGEPVEDDAFVLGWNFGDLLPYAAIGTDDVA